MSPIYPGDLVRYRIPWDGVPAGTQAEFLGHCEGLPGAFTVLVQPTAADSPHRVPLLCLQAVNPRRQPTASGVLQEHLLPGGVRVGEGRDLHTQAPYWAWDDPHTQGQRQLIWHRQDELTEYRITRDGPAVPTGVTVPTGPTHLQAHDTACGFFQRRASGIPEPPYTTTDAHTWIHALPRTPHPWRPQILRQPAPSGHGPNAVVAVCRAPQGRPLFAALAYWQPGTIEITNHHTRTDLRARLIHVTKLAAQA